MSKSDPLPMIDPGTSPEFVATDVVVQNLGGMVAKQDHNGKGFRESVTSFVVPADRA